MKKRQSRDNPIMTRSYKGREIRFYADGGHIATCVLTNGRRIHWYHGFRTISNALSGTKSFIKELPGPKPKIK